ncbi:hypothetical protein HDU93_005117 [Gonapodya sp. JEL0774]|nr:hypothetical protein HDU93_005117 [Gonapodya sp. JEL0774]
MTTVVKSTDILKSLKVLMLATGGIVDYKSWRDSTVRPVTDMTAKLNKSFCIALLMTISLTIQDRMNNVVKVGTAMDVWKWMEKTYMVVSVAAKQNAMKEWNSVMATGKTTEKYNLELWMKYEEYKAMGGEPYAGTISLVYLEGIQDA